MCFPALIQDLVVWVLLQPFFAPFLQVQSPCHTEQPWQGTCSPRPGHCSRSLSAWLGLSHPRGTQLALPLALPSLGLALFVAWVGPKEPPGMQAELGVVP